MPPQTAQTWVVDFENAGADALTRHFKQAEMGDAADLDAGAIILQTILHPLFDRPVVAVFFHVDEVDDNQAGKIAQTQLTRDFIRCFKICLQRSVFNGMFACRASGVDVYRDQRLGLVDDDIAAGLQRHLRLQHAIELCLDAVAREDRRQFAVGLNDFRVARHEHAHEVLGLAIAFFTGNSDLGDVLVVKIADRTLDQAAFLINESRCGRCKCKAADILPQPHQIFVVALDFRLGAHGASGAQDHAHAFRHFKILDDVLQALAILDAGDLARNTAATCGVWHQDRVPAGEREIGRESCTLVAAFFLDDLNEQNLTALDDVLDIVLTALEPLMRRNFFHCIFGANRFDFIEFVVDLVFVLVRATPRSPRIAFAAILRYRPFIIAFCGFVCSAGIDGFRNHIRFNGGCHRLATTFRCGVVVA